MGFLIRLLMCILFAGLILYKYVDRLNELTELRLSIPAITKELREIEEKNVMLQYEIEKFESPEHLIELAKLPEMGHLRYPSDNEVIKIPRIREEKDMVHESKL